MDKKLNLYVLTGFLGSGKTTVLLRLLDVLKDKKVGVIQNEFGKIGVDGTIIKRDNIEMIEINKGSIFCSCLKISFAQSLAEMSKMDLDYVFVESSGLADPSNIEEILEGVEVLDHGATYDLKGVLCLIDGVNFIDQLEDLETVNRQLKHCHMAIINKVDLISEEELKNVIQQVREVNPICDIETCTFGEFSMDFLERDLLKNKWAENEESTNTIDNKPKSLTMNFNGAVNKDKFEEFLNIIKTDSYRIKGFFNFEEGWKQVDVVGKKIDYKECEPRETSQLVFISKIGPNIIKPIINNWNEIIEQKMELKN